MKGRVMSNIILDQFLVLSCRPIGLEIELALSGKTKPDVVAGYNLYASTLHSAASINLSKHSCNHSGSILWSGPIKLDYLVLCLNRPGDSKHLSSGSSRSAS